MRLICPNCGAQYEVAEDAVPESGRDVQCSNCGHTWFESPGASVAAEEELTSVDSSIAGNRSEADDTATSNADEPDFFEDETEAPESKEESAYKSETADASSETETLTNKLFDEDETSFDDLKEQTTQASNAPATRHGLESSVADILREEADREQAARLDDNPLEVQTAMPVEPTESQATVAASSRIARLKGKTDEANAAAVAAMAATEASGKEALPDIDEISDTLRTNAERGEVVPPAPEEVEETKRKGFRWGFWGIILLILVAVLIYLFSDMIIAAVPAVEGPVTQYASVVDGVRSSINGVAETAVSSLEGDEVATE